MTSTPIELGALLDGWVASRWANVVETPSAVTVSRLGGANVQKLAAAVLRVGWTCDLHDGAGEPIRSEEIHDDFGPFVATIKKASEGADRRILTLEGLRQAISEPEVQGIWQIACAREGFASGTISFNPWGRGEVFAPASPTKSPLDVVREGSGQRLVPADIRKWLLRGDLTEAIWNDTAFKAFAAASAPALIRSLASEVVGQGSVVFLGPPRLNMVVAFDRLVDDLGYVGFKDLSAAAAWVFEDSASAEQRHALFAAEFARSVTRTETVAAAFRDAGRDILEGARLAFQLSQSDLSREAIKAQGDLRKSIADDTAKAAEGTRTLAGAVAVAIATAITLVAARSTATVQPWVLALVAAVVAGYLIVVAGSGWAYLHLQNQLRQQWRTRFYRFIPAEDYEGMVTKPTRSAARPYHFVGAIAVLIACALGWLALQVMIEQPGAQTGWHNTLSAQPPVQNAPTSPSTKSGTQP
ncbi:hypothetical protein MesoLj113a_45270 [Mesorhizobium sp. 113-1-2]|uniref:hypothetical protein n=1 Tax=Mesorhizobium sp. 113-1-2 TaxID=2744515 RepID=UPI001925EF15|nr:hypothetical protein [Mesorhizobium sp. 113-1-2]BCG73369.1 hypothetical protein MesoLj113a_45270 [Mesorhizobium sp. 113-1-2]